MKNIAYNLLLCSLLSIGHPLSIDINLDCVKVPEAIKQGNATFYIIYNFCLDENLCPSKIKKIEDEFIGENIVARCLSSWKFKNFHSNDNLTVVLHWKHAVGWDNLSIISEMIELKVKLKNNVID